MDQPQQPPPNNQDIERAMIGAALTDDYVLETADVFSTDFYNSRYAEMWRAMCDMHAAGRVIDIITLPAEMARRGAEVAPAEVIDLITNTPSSANAPDYARELKRLAKQRRLVRFSQKLTNSAYSGKELTETAVSDLRELVEETAVSHWKILTVADAYEERPPTEYIIDGILPVPSVNIWFGAPGSKKSLLLADMAATIAAGGRWLPGGNETYQSKQSGVFWIDTDNGNDVSQERFAAALKAREIPADSALFHYVSMPDPWFFASDIGSQLDLQAAIREHQSRVIIIDNLANITGDIDENSAQMVRVMSPLRRIADEMKVAIIVIHHQRKGGANGGRVGDALRGHSTIEASLDFAVLISDDEASKITTIKCTKARRFRFEDIRAQFNYEYKPGTRDLDIAWWTVASIKRGENPVRDGIVDILEANIEMTQSRLIDAVYDYLDRKYSKPKIKGWLDEMTDLTGEVTVRSGLKNAKVLSLK